MQPNLKNICHVNLLKNLPQRAKEVLVRRFGLAGDKETLESIGQDFGITRERVRQIEIDGLKQAEKNLASAPCQNVFRSFAAYLKSAGSLKREDIMLEDLGGSQFKNYVFFLLTLAKSFQRSAETDDFHAFWATDKNSFGAAKKAIDLLTAELKKKNQPLVLPASVPASYFEISKNILRGPEGLYGLKDWPEIYPKGVKDKAYLVLRKEQKPLHFTEVASLINHSSLFNLSKPVVSQTVHNELIKDPRFVLVGRGLYGLRDWGYEPGVVREVISNVLTQARKSLSRDEVLEKVLEKRQVKPNTVLLNLQNKRYFLKDADGKYAVRVI